MPTSVRAITRIQEADDFSGALHDGYALVYSTGLQAFTTVAVGGIADPGDFSGISVFNVEHYGAKGDDATDNTAAINAAIVALNAAGGGTLYFPRGIYKTVGGHVFTTPAILEGQGQGYWHDLATIQVFYNQADYISVVKCTSATADLFKFTAGYGEAKDILLHNVAATRPTAGSGISFFGPNEASRVIASNCTIIGFWIDMNHRTGSFSRIEGCVFADPVKYGLRIANEANVDWGDGCVSDCFVIGGDAFTGSMTPADAGIRWESGGGWKFTNVKFVDALVLHGIWCYLTATTGGTGQIFIDQCSIDGVIGNGIRVEAMLGGNLASIKIANTYTYVGGANYAPIYFDGALTGNTVSNCTLIGVTCTGHPAIEFGTPANAATTYAIGNAIAGQCVLLHNATNGAVSDGGHSLGGGDSIVTGTVHAAGSGAGLLFEGRNGTPGFQWYSPDGVSVNLYNQNNGDLPFRIDSTTTYVKGLQAATPLTADISNTSISLDGTTIGGYSGVWVGGNVKGGNDFTLLARADRTIGVLNALTTVSIRVANVPANDVTSAWSTWYVPAFFNRKIATVVTVLTDAATISTNAGDGNEFEVTLGGNRTLAVPTNATHRQRITWFIKQDGTGSRTLALAAGFQFGGLITSITLSTAPNAEDVLTAVYNNTTGKFMVMAFGPGY